MYVLGRSGNARPYVRWWWLSGPFCESDIQRQLQWALENGFGGVELAWIDPLWLDEPDRSAPRPAFLEEEWSRLVAFTKRAADSLGLGCDFTFGSSWPFAGSWVEPEHAAHTFSGLSGQRVGASWENARAPDVAESIYILDHLSAAALRHYAGPLLRALAPALAGSRSALFCDSLEISTERLWSPLLWEEFAARFGYRLEPFQDSLDQHPDVRYDYRKLIAVVIRREFYEPFTAMCHQHGAYARVQCHGAPTDLLAAYASVDVPESEALLFLPPFSRIAASAAAWTGKNVVSAEAFTCLYGFPGWDDAAEELWGEEYAGDLKLLADSLFANGINQLVWHGMPYRPAGGRQEFYAAVHVGPDSAFASSLPALNEYFTQVCGAMREGLTYASAGVYLPNEDAWMQGRIAEDDRTPGANYCWEMRHVRQPDELWGLAPVWISLPFLKQAVYEDCAIVSGDLRLKAMSVDVEWLDAEALAELRRLAVAGAKILWKRTPRQPGRNPSSDYREALRLAMSYSQSPIEPLLTCDGQAPSYWARQVDRDLLLFFAHPAANTIVYPLPYRLSDTAAACDVEVNLFWNGHSIQLPLHFGPNQSLLIAVSAGGVCQDIKLPHWAAPE